jgi:lysozyme
MIKAIDVSRHQGAVNWNIVAETGVEVTFIKASEGIGYIDPMFMRNAVAAKKAGLKLGFYHWLRPDNTDVQVEAQCFIEAISGLDYDWIVCDVEEAYGRNIAYVRDYLSRWLSLVQEATGKVPIIYTGLSFANTYLGGAFTSYPLWIAHYTNADEPGQTMWSDWVCWQYTEHGSVTGISGDVDLNWMKDDFFNNLQEGGEEVAIKKTPYVDVPAGHWAENVIKLVTDLNLMTGAQNSKFEPDRPVTRAELAAFANNLVYELNKVLPTNIGG